MKVLNPSKKYDTYPIGSVIKDIWKNSRSARVSLLIGTLFRVIGDIVSLYHAVALGLIVTELTKTTEADISKIYLYVGLWAISVIVRYGSHFIAKKTLFQLGIKLMLNVQKKMVAILFSKDSAWHENENSGTKIKRIEKGASGYNELLRAWVNIYVEIIIRFIAIPLILIKFDITIAGLMVFFLISYYMLAYRMQKKCVDKAYQFNVKDENLNSIIVESISNINTVRVLHIGQSILNQIEDSMSKLFLAGQERIDAFQTRNHFTAWYARSFNIAVITFISYHIIAGKYEVGLLVMFASYFFDLWTNINELTNINQDMIVARQSISRMYGLIGKDIPKQKGHLLFPNNWSTFSVENVSFSYGENEALKNISFSIKKGQKVGIVGLSGSGKSTLFKLLLKERDDYEGILKIDNTNISDITPDEYYKKVSIVPQDTEVFNFSLKENIAISNIREVENTKLIEKALSVSHVKDFVHKLPNGIDTLIGEKGVKLSGGERQRLGIARAIFKQPEILLLDEATSHLDLESEQKIKDSLHKFFQDVTAIVIAHRLTTIKEMDKIIVIENGRLIEEGSFDDLYNKKDSRFRELWDKQKVL